MSIHDDSDDEKLYYKMVPSPSSRGMILFGNLGRHININGRLDGWNTNINEIYMSPHWNPIIEFTMRPQVINDDFNKKSERYGLSNRDKNILMLNFCSADHCKAMRALDKTPVIQLQEFFDHFHKIYVNGQLNGYGYSADIESLVQYFGGYCSSRIIFIVLIYGYANSYYEIKQYNYYEYSVRTYAIACDRAFYRRKEAIYAMYL